ncbi:sigma-70 family RNA polymerase sigma factor [Limnochorda pilosa]|uniref:sigma-70 family RNA polymerase sigma factor n=1 Tax=Limnochorda pilosa TaxID=1555112 RepID=UPI00130DE78B|nr:sigma-70 family RNA polymerase sigma factor [Limnochorda pilosa]
MEPEEQALYRRAREGDPEARQELAVRHLPLVREVASRFRRGAFEQEELVQAATVGLLKALHGFDPDRGFRFSTYAVPVIAGEVRALIRQNQGLRAGRRLEELGRRLRAERSRLTQLLERSPTLAELAEAAGVETDEAFQALEALREPLSLEQPLAPEDERRLEERLAASTSEEEWAERLAVAEALERLDPRERIIVRFRFWEGQSQKEVAAHLGLSQPQVSRLERRALERLRAEWHV